MIVLLAKRTETHRPLEACKEFDFEVKSYHRAFRSSTLRRATYVFSDFDRLSFWELELAGRLYRQLARAGAKVLNDPALVRQRYSLLRALEDKGLNRFAVWRVEDGGRPDRFPVFLRRESGHQGPLSDLLWDEDQIERSIEEVLAEGVPRRGLLLVEYRAQPVAEGLFRRLGMYRVGETMVPALCAHQRTWIAKRGEVGVAGEKLYNEEYEIVATNRFESEVWPAFQAGEIEYGRADFGLVEGQVEIYEINTNPMIKPHDSHPFPIRLETRELILGKLVKAMKGIDTPRGPRIRLSDPVLRRQRRRDHWMLRGRWTQRQMDAVAGFFSGRASTA